MNEITYRGRLSVFRSEATYCLTDDTLIWNEGSIQGRLTFADVAKIQLSGSPAVVQPYFGNAVLVPGCNLCVVRPARGRKCVLSSSHVIRFGKFEDRSRSFHPFVETLVRRVAAANPRTVFVLGMSVGVWLLWITIFMLVMGCLGLVAAAIAIDAILKGPLENPLRLLAAIVYLVGWGLGIAPFYRIILHDRPRSFDPRSPNEPSVG